MFRNLPFEKRCCETFIIREFVMNFYSCISHFLFFITVLIVCLTDGLLFSTAVWMSYVDLSMKCLCSLLTHSLSSNIQDRDNEMPLMQKGRLLFLNSCFMYMYTMYSCTRSSYVSSTVQCTVQYLMSTLEII